ncbi:unnamed protein product [Cuscuta campestris]|uniref:Uncharacterized protein n=1 Tax=Cuscuta campestris TaxID=132261 RepID=A0A484LKK2_9ASTE|nr:unnamed protein product [Cuscuta campestris]
MMNKYYTRSCSLRTTATTAAVAANRRPSEILFSHPIRHYLKRFRGSLAEALRVISPGRCRKVGSSPDGEKVGVMGRSCSCKWAMTSGPRAMGGFDHHRAEAIDDCIRFINSSLSLSRSNSLSS